MQDQWSRLKSYEPLWDSWTVARQIFSGSNSNVFLMERRRGDKTILCALKVIEILQNNGGEIDLRLARALDEIERMELLSGCGYVVSFLDDSIRELRDENGKLEGYDVLIRMEYLECLTDRLRDGEILPEEEIVCLGQDICQALSAAHKYDIIHRDIKPSNIYRTAFGCYKLGDFGVSKRDNKVQQLAAVAGTMAYMSPETVHGEPSGKQSDIYSLGITLYQLLNNNFLPFTDERSTFSEREAASHRRWNGEDLPLPKRGTKQLCETVLRACEPVPAIRYKTAEEFFSLLGGKSKWNKIKIVVPVLLFAAVLSSVLALTPLSRIISDALTKPWTRITTNSDSGKVTGKIPGHSYEVICRKATWESAKVYCESQGGHLVTITSREEEREIIALLEQKGVTVCWIGANNQNSSGGYRWINGEEFEYASWGVGEPNNSGGNEHCLMLVDKKDQGWVWNDAPDNGYNFYKSKQLGFVCEWEDAKP